MRLKMECLEGPRKGDQFTIRGEVVMGRKAELSLRDVRMSKQHAKITISSEGLPQIEDLGSQNGTKLNGEKIQGQQTLKAGDKIKLGKTLLLVVEVGADETEDTAKTEGLESSIHDDWAKSVDRLLLKPQLRQVESGIPKVFHPCLQVRVKQGLTAGHAWTLGFGPRRFGRATSDAVLVEETAPDLAFEIIPQDNGSALFKTDHPDVVLLNKEAKDCELLQEGDLITIGDSAYLILFLENL